MWPFVHTHSSNTGAQEQCADPILIVWGAMLGVVPGDSHDEGAMCGFWGQATCVQTHGADHCAELPHWKLQHSTTMPQPQTTEFLWHRGHCLFLLRSFLLFRRQKGNIQLGLWKNALHLAEGEAQIA